MSAASRDVPVLDWGGGNIGSVVRALRRAGAAPRLVSTPRDVEAAERLVFPGVGAFGAVVRGLDDRDLLEPLRLRLGRGDLPFLGICVGLQALFASSEESPGEAGLGILPGAVRRLAARKVPQVGWNEVLPAAGEPLLERGYAYFVNGYAAPAADGAAWVAARTDYEGAFASAVRSGPRALAVQFHPEKSGAYGARLLERWIETTC
ncbi:MAG TPA: imidazole glycerol phosphate synthase subunit HisH [Planctomycetota bacterium]|nr:imidazole glycerol phosphate synthase subunit HisH [Planctomycetota bacterium]